jgi:hypothetical protein
MIIDDLTPFREMTPALADAEVKFLNSKKYMIRDVPGAQRFDGDDGYTGQTAPQAATIVYYLKNRHIFGPMKLEIYDQSGKMVKELPTGIRKGINVVNWSATLKPPKVPVSPQLEGYSMTGPYASPGEYTVRLSVDEKEYESKIIISLDPKSPYSIEDREIRQQAVMKAYNLLEDLAYMDRQVTDIRAGADKLKGDVSQPLSGELIELSNKMDTLNGKIVATQVGKITGEERLREKVAFIYGSIQGYQGRPTGSQLNGLNELASQVENINMTLESIKSKDLEKVNDELKIAGKKEIIITPKEVFMGEP